MGATVEAATGTVQTPWLPASLDELLACVDDRQPFLTSDSKSGNRFEAVRYEGERMILKFISVDDDWIMRATGDVDCRLLRLLASAIPARIPVSIDDAVVAAAPFMSQSGHRGAALLMHDVAAQLVRPGGEAIALDTHARFISHMAELHAAFWGFQDSLDLMPLAHHYTILTPGMAELEAERGGTDPVPVAVAEGWAALRRSNPRVAAVLKELADDPGPLVSAVGSTPQTFIHADWKLGNVGEHSDGRTILLDWDRCGEAPAAIDLAWYLAVNCDRLPQTKEATVETYRDALARSGVVVDTWWERQLALALLGAALQLAWSKTHDPAELGWWCDRVAEGERFLA